MPASALAATGPRPSAQELQSLLERKLALREKMAAEVDNNPPGPAGLALEPGTPAELREISQGVQFHGPPGDIRFGRVAQNPQANVPGSGATLAEPVAANNADVIFAAGNFAHAEFSPDGGLLWIDDSPSPVGPPNAEIPCCDNDVVIDDARRVGFHSVLYVNPALTNGVVRIHVRQTLDGGTACAYDVAGGDIGNFVLPDFPHLGLTKRFLYLTTNEILPGFPFQRARMYRFNIDQMSDCAPTVAFNFVEWPFFFEGQRVWVPVGGTNNSETMYWGHNVNATTFRLFFWDENSGAFTLTRPVAPSNFTFAGADCRGGTNNTNYITGVNTSIIGFQLRGALTAVRDPMGTPLPPVGPGPGYHTNGIGFYWISAAISPARPQAFIRAVLFRDGTGNFAVVAQPDIFSGGFCFAFPHVTANSRGDLGMGLVAGGRAGGGAIFPATSAYSVSDEFTGGNGGFGGVFFTWALGTHNPADGRFGDYFSIHPYEPCEKWFGATGYRFAGGTGLANVDSRYIEFGRNQSFRCYNSHTGQVPNP